MLPKTIMPLYSTYLTRRCDGSTMEVTDSGTWGGHKSSGGIFVEISIVHSCEKGHYLDI